MRQSPGCLGQPMPPVVGRQFARGCLLVDTAGRTPEKAKSLGRKAARAFRQASRAAARAARRKKNALSGGCAAELRGVLGGAEDQTRRLIAHTRGM